MKRILTLALGLGWWALLPVQAQTTTTPAQQATAAFDTAGFPQWVKDLRRGEIVAFGSFPFTMFFTLTLVDTYRSATHNWDIHYAPWPLKAFTAGAIDLTKDEQLLTLTAAATGSVVLALIDFLILHYKRTKQARELKQLPAEVPIIIRKPLAAENPEPASAGEVP
ncbi:MAG: hypothetical protein LBU25_03000 [Treponema sp.]|jgi:hypothetical protein|nr:hypothetical protein [Treponema sp.]